MTAVRSLGPFRPTALQSELIETQIKPLLPACCARERVSVRIPDARVTPHPDNLQWHQDGGGPAGTVRHMVVWASEQPTEVQLPTGETVTGVPFELIWFNNDLVRHRQPTGTNEGTRWFASVRCSGDPA